LRTESLLTVISLQSVDDFESRFPNEDDREHVLNLIRAHLGDEDAATTTSSTMRSARKDEDAEELAADDATLEELDEMEDLVDEGTGQGAMEEVTRDIDEEDA
jgi:hypothetical protein